MKLRPGSRETSVSAKPAFLALGAVAVIVVFGVTVAALSSPKDVKYTLVYADNGSVVTEVPAPMAAADVTPTAMPSPYRIVTGADAGSGTDGSGSGGAVGHAGDKTARHIAYAFQPNVNGIADFVAYWNVPQRPPFDGVQNHTIFLWTGIQQGTSGLVQAVLEWDHDNTGRYWTLACWVVNRRDQTYSLSPRIYAYPGDLIRAELRYEADAWNPGRKVWHVILTDETHDQTIDLFDSGGAVDSNRDVTVFSGVLEGIGYVYSGIDLPPDVKFYDMAYTDEDGKSMPIYLTGYVDPGFPEVAVEYEDGPDGSPVIIHTKYGQ